MSANDPAAAIDAAPHFAWHFEERGRRIECRLSEGAFDSWLQRGDHGADMARLRRYARAIAVAHTARRPAVAGGSWIVHIEPDAVHCDPAVT
ncbi:MAG: hypothetical protein MUC36_09525 [Planctomycetes bacterium]|jgi:hypothetical protein|nr:hypothetical protein [Planctomycetota bacterium]